MSDDTTTLTRRGLLATIGAAAAAASTAGAERRCDHAALDDGEACPNCDHVAPLPAPGFEVRRINATVKENTIELDPDLLDELPDAPELPNASDVVEFDPTAAREAGRR